MRPILFSGNDSVSRLIKNKEETSDNIYTFLWDSSITKSDCNYNKTASYLRGFDMHGIVIVENKSIFIEDRICELDSHY